MLFPNCGNTETRYPVKKNLSFSLARLNTSLPTSLSLRELKEWCRTISTENNRTAVNKKAFIYLGQGFGRFAVMSTNKNNIW